jgi:hypothetical protein
MDGRSRAWAYQALYYAVGGVAIVLTLAPRLHGLRDWLSVVAFYAGAGSMGFLFLRWRRQGDGSARNWCLAAFGLWMLGVLVASGAYTPGTVICGAALLVGAVGALVTLLRPRPRSEAPAASDEERASSA